MFVETVGGDLTIKIENNTESGEGVYSEPVDHADQTLDDAEILYAVIGNLVLFKIRPYQENAYRYIVFNSKLHTAMRFDEIQHACILLPDDQGIVFPGGYYLQTGEFKRFDHGLRDLFYERTIAASNGEDYLYIFHNHDSGNQLQLRYNRIRQTIDTPLLTSGQTFFPDGEMVCFKAHEEPQKHHAIQIWQTPFTGPNYVPESDTDSLLFKIGNKDLVRGMAECSEVLLLVDKDDNFDGLYTDLAKRTGDILDSYYWINKEETHHLDQPLLQIRATASAAIEEFEKVVRLKRETSSRTEQVTTAIEETSKTISRARFDSIDEFVDSLSKLREQRGHAIALRELKYVDLALVEQLDSRIAEQVDRLSRRCADFLASDRALDPYRTRVTEIDAAVQSIARVSEAKELKQRTDQTAAQLELLTETVSNLKIDDAIQRTKIIDTISDVYASLNRTRSTLKARTSELLGSEGRAEFASQLKLLQQTVSGYLDACDTPDKCDGYLTRLMVQVEELEGRFAEFDEFVAQLTQRREEIYNAFEARRVQLVESRNRRAESLAQSADRILNGIRTKASSFKTLDELLGYFASDLMVDKVRGIIDQLQALDDAVRVGDLQGRLKTTREDAVRQLKDRQELFDEGGDAIRLGRHRFAVNRQPLDLTTVIRNGALTLHLTGTQFFEELTDERLLAAKDLWEQEFISENRDLSRAEYLAGDLFLKRQLPADWTTQTTRTISPAFIQNQMASRFQEGYVKGVHDHDAALILSALWTLDHQLSLLRHSPAVRSAAYIWWNWLLSKVQRHQWQSWLAGYAKLMQAFPAAKPAAEFRSQLTHQITEAFEMQPQWGELVGQVNPCDVANYVFEALSAANPHFVHSRRAYELCKALQESLPPDELENLKRGIKEVASPVHRFVLARNCANAFIETRASNASELDPSSFYADEVAVLLIEPPTNSDHVVEGEAAVRLKGLVGDHPRIRGGELTVHYHELLSRLAHYQSDVVPRYQALAAAKQQVVAEARQRMRLDEFKASVLSSFVRNRLIDEVYLPVIGDNLAKQMGTVGEGKRTDRMGLLLLISPPGYGKTTLMEYVANRLGLVFVKVNGPAIGHAVTSLDPAEAPNAAAREEVERLNLALEMGDNIMLYLDDIQHTNPELLQKFISLCDATRKIEGVRNGRTRTYDLRGRRVAVVMAGNPYTESGQRFQIPDMLSNRADVYNLGEIIGGAEDAFEISYLENALTSNELLAPLAAGVPEDARQLIKAVQRGSLEGVTLQGNYSLDTQRSMFEVLTRMTKARDVILKVNRAYIRSAAQADAYRTEPPFKLQGSYRNMNRLAGKIVPLMDDAELQRLILSSYEQDAQTLTTDNEANLLKLKELLSVMTPTEQQRWDSIKYAFVENTRMSAISGDDQAAQVMRQLASMRDGLESIRAAIVAALSSANESSGQRNTSQLQQLDTSLQQASQRIAGAMEATAGELQTLGRQQAASPPDQKVVVQHQVPRVMVDLIRGQFHLMQEWMKPLLEGSQVQSRELANLKLQLERLMRSYQAMQQDLDDAGGGPAQ